MQMQSNSKSGTSKPVLTTIAAAFPPQAWFSLSAIFHYLGPSFAVLLFPAVGILGVAWLRIASAAAIFALWTRPIDTFRSANTKGRLLLVGLGACLAFMNTSFYLALDQLPMSLVAAIEFAGAIGLALYSVRSLRNVLAIAFVMTGVFMLIDVKWSSNPVGLFWAACNSILFTVYIILGHKVAESGATGGTKLLGCSMMIALVFVFPIGFMEVIKVVGALHLLVAGIGVGICSSVLPYICDQLAMSRLPRATFALMLALMPATAAIVAAIVLAQIPTAQDIMGIVLVMLGIAIHQPTVKSPSGENAGAAG